MQSIPNIMSEELNPPCPNCNYEYPYPDGDNMVCPECDHVWNPETVAAENLASEGIVAKDSNGVILQSGDTVMTVRDLPVKGFAKSIKVGTKITNIRLVDGDHNIDCKIKEFGGMAIKSEFVKKI